MQQLNILIHMINERTLEELKASLTQLDELTLIELLNVTSTELVMVLEDYIEERYDVLLEYFDEGEEDYE